MINYKSLVKIVIILFDVVFS